MASIFTFHQLLISSTSNMRAWSTPFLRPMAPFLAGGAVTFYLINAAQEAALKSTYFTQLICRTSARILKISRQPSVPVKLSAAPLCSHTILDHQRLDYRLAGWEFSDGLIFFVTWQRSRQELSIRGEESARQLPGVVSVNGDIENWHLLCTLRYTVQ